MAQNLIFIFTEGDHDGSFIYRILKSNGAKTYHKTIKDYDEPLKGLFTRGAESTNLEQLNLGAAGRRFLPHRVMRYDTNTLLLYTLGGDGQVEKRINLFRTIDDLKVVDPDELGAVSDIQLSILYFLDADTKGTATRLLQVTKDIERVFPGEHIPQLEDGNVVKVTDVQVGAFIFKQNGTDEGMLEDVMIPLMRDGNNDVFLAAEMFLGTVRTCALFSASLTFHTDGTTIRKVNTKDYAHKKSLVGAVGQLQMSGKSNTVCISDADYLNDNKILASPTCQSIMGFIQQAMI